MALRPENGRHLAALLIPCAPKRSCYGFGTRQPRNSTQSGRPFRHIASLRWIRRSANGRTLASIRFFTASTMKFTIVGRDMSICARWGSIRRRFGSGETKLSIFCRTGGSFRTVERERYLLLHDQVPLRPHPPIPHEPTPPFFL